MLQMTNEENWMEITDPDDPRIEDYRDIREKDLMGRGGRNGLFIGEAILVVEVMLQHPGMTRSILVSRSQLERVRRLVAESPSPDTPILVAEGKLIESIAGFDIHRGVLACGNRPDLDSQSLDSILPGVDEPATVLICDRINNIDNIGLLFRNAAAFGVDCVILSPDCHDPLYRKSLRVSIGHALRVPYHRSSDWAGTLEALKQRGIRIIGTSIDPKAVPLDQARPPERVGLIMGSEFDGLGEESIRTCDRLVRIPMAAGTDSLNVGVAAAVCLHHFARKNRV